MDKSPHSIKYQTFKLLYKQFGLPLMKFLVKRMGGDYKAAEEVFSQTILAAWKGWNTFENKSSFFTWVCRIGLNKIADYYKSQVHYNSRFVVPLLDDFSQVRDNRLSIEERLVLEELKDSVKECLNLLPEEKKRLLYLRYWRDLSHQTIGKRMGISDRAVEGKLYRARRDFEEIYLEKYPEFACQYLLRKP